jgi:hypothetical protein
VIINFTALLGFSRTSSKGSQLAGEGNAVALVSETILRKANDNRFYRGHGQRQESYHGRELNPLVYLFLTNIPTVRE